MSDTAPMTDNPEQFKIPFLVGVAGHRDLVPAEVPAIRAALLELLRALRDGAPAVQIVLLSSMAEGADLLAAEVALELGLGITALLPYSPARCRADLSDEAARSLFDRAMARAERLELQLPSGVNEQSLAADGAARDLQFQSAGALVARYSSLLIAIWDGQETEHAAGTARVVGFRRRGISPDDLPRLQRADLLLGAQDNDLTYEIRCSRQRSPAATGAGADGVHVLGFESGEERFGPVARGLPKALKTLLRRTSGFNRDVDDYGAQIARQGRRLAPPTPYETPASLQYIDRLFTAADWLGVHFRRCFTRALRARYVLWAVLAFLLLTFKKQHDGIGGLVSILGVLLIFGLGWLLALWAHRRSWQRRYLDYRALAEGLRVDFYWEVSGVRAQFEGEFAHESFLQKQDVELEWIRAAMRAVSLRCALHPAVTVPNGYAHTFAAWVGDPDPVNGSGQLLYYRQRGKSLARRQELAEHIARAMLFSGLALGILLATAAVLELRGPSPLPPALHSGMLWALALLTVYSAIFEIYLGEKADRALIRQYRYMDSLFSFAAREMRSARSATEKLEILRSLGHACLAEHAQWILAHRDKRIEGMRW
ncbi:MAG: hypothetical protein WCD08_06990 [Steroidobacteraceae bacterium]